LWEGVVAREGSGGKEVDVSVCVKSKNSRRQRLLYLRVRAITCLPKQCDFALGSSEPVNTSPFIHMSEPVNTATFTSNERDAATSLHMSEPVNAATFPSNDRDAATSLHMSEPVNAATFPSNERDAATSLHMSEPVNAATFSCLPYTFRNPTSTFQAF
jgi:hypothetical protein